MTADARLDEIKSWVESELELNNYKIETASADASFRRYFRLTAGEKNWIVMDAPPEKEDCQPFIVIAGLIEAAGVQSPHVYRFNQSQGFMLLSDLGSSAYLDQLNNASVDALYSDAIQAIIKMQTIQADLPAYDETLLRFEMSLFTDWFIEKHLNINLDNTQSEIVNDTFSILADSALQQEKVFVHRDFHSRNLMVTEENNPGVIDFQDAVKGSPAYDLVSLIKDCYIAWPRQKQLQWVDLFLKLSPLKIDRERFIQQLDFMGMQRHLKAVGIFARLNYRDSKPGYLNDIPRTLAYVVDVCQRYTELKSFSSLLSSLNINGDAETQERIK